jgi:hypothetical protein
MTTINNAFRALGISPTNSLTAIRKAYIAGAKRTHPDAHPGKIDVSGLDFKIIKDAYDTLKDAAATGLLNNTSPSGLSAKSYYTDDLSSSVRSHSIPIDKSGWDDLIARMSPIDITYRFASDIGGYDDIFSANAKYVLINARHSDSKDWGVVLASYLTDSYLDHKGIVDSYLRGTSMNPKDIISILGGGDLDFNWGRDDLIHISGTSKDFGPPISASIIKSCLRTLVKTCLPWRIDLGDKNFKVDGDTNPDDVWTSDAYLIN